MTEVIQQEVQLAATPQQVYRLLIDESAFSQMTGGAPTSIATEEGGAFSCFGGMILGRHIECIPNQRLVQAWRAKPWEPGFYSLVRFELAAEGEGTKLTLHHSSFPEGQAEHLNKGWHENYWEPMKKALA